MHNRLLAVRSVQPQSKYQDGVAAAAIADDDGSGATGKVIGD